MTRTLLLLQVMSVLGCVACATTSSVTDGSRKPGGNVAWPSRKDVAEVSNLGAMDGPAALAASAALREVIQSFSAQSDVFAKCLSPAEALDVRVFKWRELYYVTVDERFDRCGGARNRFPGWFESYAVSPAGEVLARRGDSR
ncbi:hypothetical protein F0U61_07315 [Archangium violaceum]|uniref:hypothetical protein n=1 Tax=Archangium violaceum TaxID=83451 RepID=UPI002B2B922F|nr:hypothetical protein F0U61_07315 [Archangium violaceum]